MGSLKLILLAGVASLSAISAASAADLFLPPPPPVEAPAQYVPVEFSGGFYLRGDVGAGALQLRNQNSTFNPDNGFVYHDNSPTNTGKPPNFAFGGSSASEQVIAGLGAGYQFNKFFRADVTGEYRFSSSYRSTEIANDGQQPFVDGYSGNISSAVFLVNGYVDLGTYYCLTPYLGAGIGVSINKFSGITDSNLTYYNTPSGTSESNTKASIAYAFMAGVSYNLTSNLKLDLGYRYLDMGSIQSGVINCYGGTAVCGNNSRERQSYHLASHDIRLGLRYMFNDVAAAPQYAQQLPLIRKY